jgi:predicted dehydrogenase
MMIKAAIIGAGFMGATHNEALRRIGVPVAGVLGVDQAETDAFAGRVNARPYPNLATLLSDADVTVVHLCTPNNLHYPMAKAAIEAGKHVLCEKPLAVSSQEATELVQLANDRKVVGAVNYSIRFYPLVQEAYSRIHQGLIGEPRILHAEYCQDWLFYPTDWNWRLISSEGGKLRVVGDVGSHVLDMLMWLTGLEVIELMADMATFLPVRKKPRQAVETFASKLSTSIDAEDVEVDTEDFASLLLRFSNGARGVVTLSQISAGRKNNFWWEVNGSKGSLCWKQECPNELWIGYRDKPNEVMLKDPALMLPESRRYAAYPGGHAEGYPDTFARHFSDFYKYIEEGNFTKKPTFPTFEDGRRELVIGEMVLTSIQEKRWVKIEY